MVIDHSQAVDCSDEIRIQLVYALGPADIWAVNLTLPPLATIAQALSRSDFAQAFPALDLAALELGIYGQRCSPDHVLCDGDRIEIYRPLDFDPMESRRRRARHRKDKMSRA